MLITLAPPQILEIAGPDAVAFAHAQFCNDVLALANDHWQWNAWLSPQGRMRAFFHLLRYDNERLRLLLRGGDAETMRTELARFVFRAKVQLHVLSDILGIGADEASALPVQFSAPPVASALATSDRITGIAMPGVTARWLLLWPADALPPAAIASTDARDHWKLDDIHAGLPELAPALEDQLLPQWLSLDHLDAISVSKGCYPGQEIMARLHFKGGNKRSLYRLEFRATNLPEPGTILHTPDSKASDSIGVVVMAAPTSPGSGEALAVLTNTAIGKALHCDALDEVKVLSRFSHSIP